MLISTYNLFINIGTILGFFVFIFTSYKRKYKIGKTVCIGILVFFLLQWGFFASNLIRGLNNGDIGSFRDIILEKKGAHFIGRVIFAVSLFPVLYKAFFQKEKKEWVSAMDSLCLFLIVQHIFNRIACLLNGCCGGKLISESSSLKYPTQLFEAGSMVILLGVCIFLFKKNISIYFIFEIWFAVTIFISEFMIDNSDAVYYLGLDAIQYAAIVLIIISLITRKFAGINNDSV